MKYISSMLFTMADEYHSNVTIQRFSNKLFRFFFEIRYVQPFTTYFLPII